MKAIYFKKDGTLCLVDRMTGKEKKVKTIKNYLDCPVLIEEGLLFETFFKHLIEEKDFLNVVFKETMGNSSIDNFREEWELPSNDQTLRKGINYIKAYKIFDCVELDEENNFIDIRIDFDGFGEEDELYNLEFIPLNELKPIPFILADKITIYRTVKNISGEELFFRGASFTLLFELIGTILYILTIHDTPAGRVSAKKKFIKILTQTNLIEMLEIQKEDAVEVQNFEEAAMLKKILDRLKNGFIED